jgi:hypothetical protein
MFLGHCSESISRKLQSQTGYWSFPIGVGIQTFSFTPGSEMVGCLLNHFLTLRLEKKEPLTK